MPDFIMPPSFGVPVNYKRSLDKPRFQLSHLVPLTPEARAEFDEWAKEFFGIDPEPVVYYEQPKKGFPLGVIYCNAAGVKAIDEHALRSSHFQF